MFGNLSGGYSDLWKAIIRPERDEYTLEDLGPSEFKIKGIRIHRRDFEMKNKQGKTLQCSHFEPIKRPCKELPCVVYLHGNSSSRLESLNCLRVLLPQNITLFSFDFAGCGLSEGEYISLGWYERDDVETIVKYLRESKTVSSIGLWGRSMGAVTALMHADRDPSIAGLVLDSAFSSLRTLAEELCRKYTKIPKFVMSGAISLIRSSIQSRAKFDVNDLNPLKNHVTKAFIPALFISGNQDEFITSDHTKALHAAYAGDKNIILVEGDHNSTRPSYMFDSVGIFFFNTLQVEVLVPQGKSDVEQDSSVPEFSKTIPSDLIGFYSKEKDAAQESNGQINQQQAEDDFFADEAMFEEELRRAIEESKKDATASTLNKEPPNQPQQSLGDQFEQLNIHAPKKGEEENIYSQREPGQPQRQPWQKSQQQLQQQWQQTHQQPQKPAASEDKNKPPPAQQTSNKIKNNPLEYYFTDYK